LQTNEPVGACIDRTTQESFMTAEIERFISNSKSDAALQAAIVQRDGDLDALIGLANERGYRISRADVDAYIAARSSELDDNQLDDVAGGGHMKKKDWKKAEATLKSIQHQSYVMKNA
jgi:predicted ribosomally synthesized peptide with nif11-like leader